MYVMISTRLDLAYTISLLSRFMSNLGIKHWHALKWLLRYISGSVNVGLCYMRIYGSFGLEEYVDSDFAGDRNLRKSTTSLFFTLEGNYISWQSQLQPLVALSSTKEEYMAVIDAFKEVVWLQGILKEIRVLKGEATVFLDS